MSGKPVHSHAHGHTHGDDHSHGQGHTHSHGHGHGAPDFGRAFVIGIVLNSIVVVAEVGFGLFGHSVALLSDAAHNLSDVLGLGMAFAAMRLARRVPSQRFTYGLRGGSILAALLNAIFLLVVTGALSLAAIERFFEPAPVASTAMMGTAALAILVNGSSAALFAAGRHGDINIRGAFLHLAADAFIAAGVVVAGLVIRLTGWSWVDPLTSLAVNAIIIAGSWSLLRESVAMSLAGVPRGIEAAEVRAFLGGLPGVAGLHDLHIWAMSTSETALTAHLVMPGGCPGDDYLCEAAATLKSAYGIGHATLQVETNVDTKCALAPEETV